MLLDISTHHLQLKETICSNIGRSFRHSAQLACAVPAHCVRVGRARHVREQLLKPGFLEENQSKINIFHHIWPWACMGKHGHAWANL